MSNEISHLKFGLSRLNPVIAGTFGAMTLTGAVAGGDQTWSNVGDMTFANGSILASGSTNGNTLLLKANDTTFITLTTGATDTLDIGAHSISGDVTVADTKVFKTAAGAADDYFSFQVQDTDTSTYTEVMKFINDDKPGVLFPAKVVVGSSDVSLYDRGALVVSGTTELQGSLNIAGAYSLQINTSGCGITTNNGACKYGQLAHGTVNTTTSTEYSWRFLVYTEEVMRVLGTATGANTIDTTSCLAHFYHPIRLADEQAILTSTAAADYFHLDAYNTNDSARKEAIRIANTAVASQGALIGFYGAAPVAQAAHIANTAGDDATAVNAILVVLENLGLVATS